MSREECQKAVCSGDPGDFLVRDSTGGSKMVIVLNDHGSPANYQILRGGGFMHFVPGIPYKHVSDALQPMRQNDPNGNDGRPLPLGNIATGF